MVIPLGCVSIIRSNSLLDDFSDSFLRDAQQRDDFVVGRHEAAAGALPLPRDVQFSQLCFGRNATSALRAPEAAQVGPELGRVVAPPAAASEKFAAFEFFEPSLGA